MRRTILAVLIGASVLGAGPLQAAGPLLSPAGIAYMKAEEHRIDRQFATRAAQLGGVPVSVVLDGMPRGPRITDTGQRIIQVIERHTGGALSRDVRAGIQAADDERKAALARAREEAARR
ncbi:hypothetical protein G3580_15620 [Nitrogeniibacter mangrovi]|uniref:Uncharacterized protein n=1 Tax=Nitrogeniibacter mangrovi TaxID=2016596 RepID=A0A6C1B658_9RHOO|nr:hypothetical protein [Nitrogeniibacter mangrovi]QID18923.1 hypothetical protein G3580_15620 [Nitrogeniibacter mangrovi]